MKSADAAAPSGIVRGTRAPALHIVPLAADHVTAVRAFNERMRGGRAPTDFLLPDRPDPAAPSSARAIRSTHYVAVDDGGEVRGGFLLMEQPAWVGGRPVTVANYQAPLSEGIVDNRYGMVGMLMLRHVQRRWPHAFVVGMGAADRPLPRLLSAAGWSVRPVPFLFRLVRPGRVLRQLRPLRRRAIAPAADLAAWSGAAHVAAALLHARGAFLRPRGWQLGRVHQWDEWADEIWIRARDRQSFGAVRDASTLRELYPLDDPRYRAYVLRAGDTVAAWAVCAETAMKDHLYFGNLKVATVLDAMALDGTAPALAAAVTRGLAHWADLVITNQSHAQWIDAFRRAGFVSARSNYLLGVSRKLSEDIGEAASRVHVTRGDGDGRIHLI